MWAVPAAAERGVSAGTVATMTEFTLTEVLPGLRATAPAPLPFLDGAVVRSFLLERNGAHTVIYNSPGLGEAADHIRRLGPMDGVLINHWHEEMYGRPEVDAPVFVHERDRPRAEKRLTVDGVFRGRRRWGEGLEIIPAPGHTAGATAFLWTTAGHRVLFTGDSLWKRGERWEAVVLGESSPVDYARSLELMAELDADVIAPWVALDDAPPVEHVDPAAMRRTFLDVAGRVRAQR